MDPISIIVLGLILLFIFSSVTTVTQGTVVVITAFGKYNKLMYPGLNFKVPFYHSVYKRVSVQNRSVELEFQAITSDQANVNFKTMLLYSVLDQNEDTIKNVAFKFINDREFMSALVRTVEGSIRSFVASKKQSEVLALRKEIVLNVKQHIDNTLAEWGFHLIDLQINDIAFDEVIMKSMAKVVASNNLRAAAENEGQALLITKTKGAEADGNAIKIAATAEREAAQLRGQGVALFREEVAKGMSMAAKQMHDAQLDSSLILFSMWTEALKHFAEQGKGNVIFLDGSNDNLQKTMRQLMAINKGFTSTGESVQEKIREED